MLLLAPAFVTYVLMVDPRFALQPRRVALAAGLLALGLVPYGFIAIRTLQGATYIETPIRSFADGVAAVSSRPGSRRCLRSISRPCFASACHSSL